MADKKGHHKITLWRYNLLAKNTKTDETYIFPCSVVSSRQTSLYGFATQTGHIYIENMRLQLDN